MAIIHWSPFEEMENIFEETTPAFSFLRTAGKKAVNIYEKDNQVVAEMELPGMDMKDVDVTVEGGYLRVAGKKEEKEEEKKKNYYRKEIRSGAFEQIVRLPSNVEENKSEAEYKDGILRVTIPKVESSSVKKIEIKHK